MTNADDDVAGITVSTISRPTSEAGASATFSVILNTQPSGDVAVGLTSSDTTEGTVTPANLTFTARIGASIRPRRSSASTTAMSTATSPIASRRRQRSAPTAITTGSMPPM